MGLKRAMEPLIMAVAGALSHLRHATPIISMKKDMMEIEKIKVFLSEPQVLFREGVHFILSGEEDIEVTGETTSNEEAFTQIESNPPNIAILSMTDDRLNGSEVIRRINRQLPSVKVILITDKIDKEQLFAAMKIGASACLTKDTDPKYLLDTIREVAKGSQPIIEAMLMPELALRVQIEFEELDTLSKQLRNLLANLASIESEILSSIAAGNGIKQVAAKLNINEETIKHNLGLIMSKLVDNEHAKAIIEVTRSSFLVATPNAAMLGRPAVEYLSKKELTEFKESLMEQLKSFIGKSA